MISLCSKGIVSTSYLNKAITHYYSTGTSFLKGAKINSPYDLLPVEKRTKILFSSYLENQLESHTYKQKKIYQDRRLKEKQRLKFDRIKIRPFAAAIKSEELLAQKDRVGSDELFSKEVSEEQSFPQNWMEDYEFYDGTGTDNVINSTCGTADPLIPPSNVPCNGCGSNLHCANPSIQGYIPMEIFKGRTQNQLKQILCQRCHFLKTYNIAVDVTVSPEMYVETISAITNKYALAILVVDLLDFPCCIWPGVQKILGDKRPIFVVGNKVDLLPRDSMNYLDHVKKCLMDQIVKAGLNAMNIKNISLISAKTGFGVEELVTQLQKIWLYKGDVYLIGCTNVGKSSLFNSLLNSDYCRVEATDLIRKATTCPWPGTTLKMLKFPIMRPSEIRIYHRFRRLFSERTKRQAEEKLRRDQATKTGDVRAATLIGRIGRTHVKREETNDSFAMTKGTLPIETLDEKKIEYLKSNWCYDTPGVMQPDQIYNLLTTEELLLLEPNVMITPRAYRIKPEMSVFLAGLARLDFLDADADVNSIRIIVYSSHNLPVVITPTNNADEIYSEYLGSELFALPRGNEARMSKWAGLKPYPTNLTITGKHDNCTTCDIVLSSAGWMGLEIPSEHNCKFQVWTPHGRGISVRTPPLLPFGARLCGKRIRDSLAYRITKPFSFKK